MSQSHRPIPTTSSSACFKKSDCNMIIWGKWKSIYEEPIQLSIQTDQGPLTQCIVDMVSCQDLCLFITEDGSIYSMGQNLKGMLGLGKITVNTAGVAQKVEALRDKKVVDIKTGANHVLILTDDGYVYGFGSNSFGQVGCTGYEGSGQDKIVWEPRQVYPIAGKERDQDEDMEEFDQAVQIQVHEDSSFLVTERGACYSWGKNEHGFLGMETKLIIKGAHQNNSAMNFSNQVPMRIKKLEKFQVQRLAIKEGKVMVFLVGEVDNSTQMQPQQFEDEEDNDSHDHQSESLHSRTITSSQRRGNASYNLKDSEFDSEEEKDTVAVDDFNNRLLIPKTKRPRVGGETSFTSSSSRRSSTSSSASSYSSKSLQPRFQNKLHQQQQSKYNKISKALQSLQDINFELVKFDRDLADSIRPLTDIENRSVYDSVLDQFVQGNQTENDVEELQAAIDKIQVKLKNNVIQLQRIESKFNDELKEPVRKETDEGVRKELQAIVEMAAESITLKKFNLVGCKMKIYQERLKHLNFLDLLSLLKDDEEQELTQERQMQLLRQCKLLTKKTQQSLKKNLDYYLQMHVGCSVTSSVALSALTNSVYSQCDLWNGLSSLCQYTTIMQEKLQEIEVEHDKIKKLWLSFQQLQQTDFNKKVEKYQDQQEDFESTKEWFEAIMGEINQEIKSVLTQVRVQMKESKRNDEQKDILFFFQTLIHDAALIRQLLFSAQQALFEGAQAPKPSPQDATIQGGTQIEGNAKRQNPQQQLSISKHQLINEYETPGFPQSKSKNNLQPDDEQSVLTNEMNSSSCSSSAQMQDKTNKKQRKSGKQTFNVRSKKGSVNDYKPGGDGEQQQPQTQGGLLGGLLGGIFGGVQLKKQ